MILFLICYSFMVRVCVRVFMYGQVTESHWVIILYTSLCYTCHYLSMLSLYHSTDICCTQSLCYTHSIYIYIYNLHTNTHTHTHTHRYIYIYIYIYQQKRNQKRSRKKSTTTSTTVLSQTDLMIMKKILS